MNDKYQNHAAGLPTTARLSCKLVTVDGTERDKDEIIVCEKELEVSVNGTPAFCLTCTPDHLTELVLGRLCTEGMIRSADDVAHLFICGEGNIAEVRLRDDIALQPYSGAEPTCCTGNRQLVERVYPGTVPEKGSTPSDDHISSADPHPEDVFLLTERFREDGALHKNTSGNHSCYIRFGDGRILSFEDIGRHNALDKAVGAMLLEDAEPEECMLFTSGRIAEDMVTKLINSGIRILISKAVPTEAAVLYARNHHLTLICKAWPDSYIRFT